MMNLPFMPGSRRTSTHLTRSLSGNKKPVPGQASTGLVFVLLAAVVAWPTLSAAQEIIYRRDWDQVRSAVSVLQLPALQRVVSRLEMAPDANMVIRYPGGDDGNAWAIELRNWLVALGISLDVIELQPGSGLPQAISIKIEPRSSFIR
jgi:hypothetical protein